MGRRKHSTRKKQRPFLAILAAAFLLLIGGNGLSQAYDSLPVLGELSGILRQAAVGGAAEKPKEEAPPALDISQIPPYEGKPYVILGNNVPNFTDAEFEASSSFETYSELDSLGRCGPAYANVGTDLMPTEKRGPIGQIKPSGWHTVRYDDIIDKKYLYNRCHLIGYQLTAENANPRNLITGTRYLNAEGMLPFENKAASYIKHTGNHVLYRVTPIFEGNNLVASGVEMEALSVEDRGKGLRFHVFCYNVQPGIVIDYATGDSHAASTETKAK